MKSTKIVIIVCIILFLIVIIGLIFGIVKKHQIIEIKFNSDGGTSIQNIEVEKGESIKLPNVTKEGFKFLGWYIGDIQISDDTKFTENTTVVAKWLDESIKKFKVTFNTDGGSNVNPLVIECGKTIKFGTNPTKTGYEFISWVDKHETPILDGALLECSDITLKANWKKDEVVEKKEETKETKKDTKKETKKETKTETEVKQTTKSCIEGELNGDKCVITRTVKEKCPDDSVESTSGCVNLSDSTSVTKECGEKSVNINGSVTSVKGIKLDSSCYYGETSSDQQSCSGIWASGKCFVDVDQNFISSCPKEYSSYNDGCYKIVSKIQYCDDEYTLTDGNCIKTVDAN